VTKKYVPINLDTIKTCNLKKRKSKFTRNQIGKSFSGGTFKKFLKCLPDVLASRDFREIVSTIIKAKKRGRPVVLGMGAHPIKVGLTPIIIDLIKRGIITSVAMKATHQRTLIPNYAEAHSEWLRKPDGGLTRRFSREFQGVTVLENLSETSS
jgi:hypothetical protein